MEQTYLQKLAGNIPGLLDIGTSVFDWAIDNPIYSIGLTMALIFFGFNLISRVKNG